LIDILIVSTKGLNDNYNLNKIMESNMDIREVLSLNEKIVSMIQYRDLVLIATESKVFAARYNPIIDDLIFNKVDLEIKD
jgi:hypothetical protein